MCSGVKLSYAVLWWRINEAALIKIKGWGNISLVLDCYSESTRWGQKADFFFSIQLSVELHSYQSDHSFSSSSESSSESLYSTAIRRDRMVATSLPTGSRLFCCSCCSWTFFSWMPDNNTNTGYKRRNSIVHLSHTLQKSFSAKLHLKTMTHLYGSQTAGRSLHLSQALSHLCLLHHIQ